MKIKICTEGDSDIILEKDGYIVHFGVHWKPFFDEKNENERKYDTEHKYKGWVL